MGKTLQEIKWGEECGFFWSNINQDFIKNININYLTIKGVMIFTGKRENDAKASMWEKEKGDDLNQNDR